ncbi:hypothetical protein F5Y09DRAFT_354066 [Xylaria sp. FL1042]|nr:hypothetical protein F5Y09DRAFT_354066 [Xylaria sp. FL1042]
MAIVSHSYVHYQERVDFTEHLLAQLFGSRWCVNEENTITPPQYQHDFPFKYNNFVYCISLPTGISSGLGVADGGSKLEQPGYIPVPTRTKEFILRLSNPDAKGMHQETRVQNEVGVLTLASAVLRHIKPAVVPGVFGWGGATRECPAPVSAQMTGVGAGPWPTLKESYRGRLKVALAKANAERINAFIERGLPTQFLDLASKQNKVINYTRRL